MVSECVALKISAIFVLFIASFVGITLPFTILSHSFQQIMPLVNALAAGVMLGLALIHLMADSNSDLSQVMSDDEYPLTNAFTAFGIIVTLSIEQGVLLWWRSSAKSSLVQPHDPSSDTLEDSLELGTIKQKNIKKEEKDNSEALVEYKPTHNDHDHDHVSAPLHALYAATSFKDLVSAYALEISTAVHSVIIGFNLGVLSDSSISTVRVLYAVLAFHQFVEGLGLGTVMKVSEKELGTSKIITFVFIFSGTVSLGVLLGLLIQPSGESESQLIIEGTVSGFAAGSLLYISLVELTAVYFNLPELENKGCTKIGMLGMFILGALIMGIIGIWA